MNKLNLGCGKDYKEGYVNLDISDGVGADIVADVQFGIPFDDDTFDEVLVNNMLTQVERGKDFVRVMNELHRVCKGEIFVRVPLVSDACAWQDPMDCRRFTPESFTYMEEGHRRYEQYGKHYGFSPFKVEILENNGRQMRVKLTPCKS
jgi:ubiquinone/menaquinone biosynthesis C-methylase UbiE